MTDTVDNVRKPAPCKPRRRRVNTGEYEALCDAVKSCRVTYIWPLINLAIVTAMRRGELLKLTWTDIDWEDKTATLSDTKNGLERVIPLSDKAIAILEKLKRPKGKVFQATEVAVRQAWERLVVRAGIKDLHFHDLRHEAISRFFEMGLSVPEVALISGHKDYRMLARYTHLRAEDVGKKMERLQAEAQSDL